MRQNRLALLSGLLIILLGVAWLSGAFDRDPSTMDLPTLDIPAVSVDRIDIEGPGVSTTIIRDAAIGWRIERPVDAAADTAAVGRLVRDIAALRLGSLVSTNADRHGRYGVDSTGSEVVVSWGDNQRRLVVSSRGPDYSTNYVRLAEGAEVYATRNRVSIPADLDRLRDRTVMQLTSGMVTRVSVVRPDERYSVERTSDGWQVTGASGTTTADSVSVAGWLRRFEPLTADGFVADLPADSVRAKVSVDLAFTTIDGAVQRLYLAEHDGALAGVLADGKDVFRLYSTRKESLAPVSTTITKE